jgi:polysaccharide pyruvyl transferase WcaK-like protein
MKETMKPKRVLLLGASFQQGNRGVTALFSASIRVIRHGLPNAEILLLEYSREKLRHVMECEGEPVSVEMINLRFSKKFYLRNNIAMLLLGALLLRLFPLKSVREVMWALLPSLREIDRSDLALALSGGDSFSDIYGLVRMVYVSLPQLLVLLLKKRLILLPQTLGPYKRWLSRVMAKYIVLRSEAVYTRDYTSQTEMTRLLRDKGLSKRLRFCYDVAFVLDTRRPENSLTEKRIRETKAGPLIGLNISGLLYRGGYTRDDQFRLGMDYPSFIQRLIRELVAGTDAAILLVPHVFGRGYESDVIACEQVYYGLKAECGNKLLLLEGEYDESEIKYMIGLCDFFVGSRMHSCIAALSQCIPAVGVAYSRKFHGVYETLELDELVADPKRIGEDRVLERIKNSFRRRESVRSMLEQKIPEVKRRVLGLLDGI